LLRFHHLLRAHFDAVEAEFSLQRSQQRYAWLRPGLRHRHHTVMHVCKYMTKVLAVSIYEDAAVVAYVLCVPATEVGIKKCVRHASERLH
jgi:hypothetical protein